MNILYSKTHDSSIEILPVLISLYLVLLSFTGLYAQTNSCEIKNRCFQNGEKVTYEVYYNWGFIWLNAANVEFTVKLEKLYNKSVFHISARGNTYESYDWIYRVRDTYETYIDLVNLLPFKFIRDVEEGDLKIYQSAIFDYTQQSIILNDKTIPFPDCTQDVLSAIYYSRNIDFSVYKSGDLIPIIIFIDEKVYNLKIKYLGKELIQTRFGKYRCIKFKPQLVEGTIFKGGDEMIVWVSDDENKVAVRVESPILVGSIKVDLATYYGLKYPLKAKIKPF